MLHRNNKKFTGLLSNTVVSIPQPRGAIESLLHRLYSLTSKARDADDP